MAAEYARISQDGSDQEEKEFQYPIARQSLDMRWKALIGVLAVAFVASLSANIYFFSLPFEKSWRMAKELPSRYARISRDTPTERVDNFGVYDSLNRTVQDAAWNDVDLEPWNGFLALDEDYAMSNGLLHAQRWPWDESKGVYIIVAAHEMHCIRMLRTSVNEDLDSIPQADRSWSYPHVLLCLNVLRESIMCNADDTPMYVGRLHKNKDLDHPRAGTGEMKMCRNWQKLLDWSHEHSACYKPVSWADGARSEIDRYKYCPDGARPWEDL